MNQIPDNLSTKDLWDEIYKGFNNNVCHGCCKSVLLTRDMSNPQPIPYVGPNFGKDPYRILFVGIETYCNDPRKDCASAKYDDTFPTEQVNSLYFEEEPEVNGYSLFWKWVRGISEAVLGMEPSAVFKHIAYSNLLKCQSREKGGDFRSSNYEQCEDLWKNCIHRAGWIYREIEEIEARNIILFSGRADECKLARLFLDDNEGRLLQKFDYEKYDLPEETLKRRRNRDLFVHLRDEARRFIITNHPRGTPFEVRREIIRIIRDDDWKGSACWKMPKGVTI